MGAGSRSRLRGSVVLVDHAPKYFAALDRCAGRHDDRFAVVGWPLAAGLVRAVAVVVPGVPSEHRVGCGNSGSACDLRLSPHLRSSFVLVNQAVEDLLTLQPDPVERGGSHRRWPRLRRLPVSRAMGAMLVVVPFILGQRLQ